MTQMFYCITLTLSKTSILFLYLRIFVDSTFRRILWISIVFMFAHGIGFLFAIIFQCVPISSNWTLEKGRCLDLSTVALTGAIFSIVEDFTIMLLPVWELRKLSFDMRKKAALAFMFAVGSLSVSRPKGFHSH